MLVMLTLRWCSKELYGKLFEHIHDIHNIEKLQSLEAAPSYRSMGYVKRGPVYDLSAVQQPLRATAIPDDLGVILRSNGNTPKMVWEKLGTPDENHIPQDSSGVDIVKLML